MVQVSELIKLKQKHPQVARTVNEILIRGLSPTQRKIYDLLGTTYTISSRELAIKHGMIQTTAAQAMREMREMGILKSKPLPNAGSPRKIIYWRA